MSVSILMLAARIALAVCLYAFLALILVVLWRDLRAASCSAGGPGRGPFLRRLREDGSPEQPFPLSKDSCLIGRSPGVELSISDDTVSAFHARVWREAGRWWLEDLDSRNGTLLNQIPVAQPAVLCTGDRIRIGRVLLEFRAEGFPGAEPALTPSPPPEESP